MIVVSSWNFLEICLKAQSDSRCLQAKGTTIVCLFVCFLLFAMSPVSLFLVAMLVGGWKTDEDEKKILTIASDGDRNE